MFGQLGWPEILGILLVVLLLFGAKRIPEVMRALRQGLDEFKRAGTSATQEIEKAAKDVTDDSPKSPPA
jgi:sec-independent protein translocase protein TatA